MEWQFDFKRTQPMVVAWKPYAGDAKGVNGAFDAVRIWIAFQGIQPAGPLVADYSGGETFNPTRPVKMEVWVPVAKGTKGDKEVKVKEVPGARVAFTVHRGSLLLLEDAHRRVLQFLGEKRVAHDPKTHRQVFHRMDPPHPENRGWEVEVQVPVADG